MVVRSGGLSTDLWGNKKEGGCQLKAACRSIRKKQLVDVLSVLVKNDRKGVETPDGSNVWVC